ncbi:hypothetical protein [Streptomyces sp. NPDC055105]|uniref:hypothetical protein n=1 Tax=Streptomyces sp. NPDC055105 TaxID=3365719 RepID=UPI0037CDE2AB
MAALGHHHHRRPCEHRSHWRLGPLGEQQRLHVSWLGSVTVFTVLLTTLVPSAIGPLARLDVRWLSTAGAMTYPL